MAEDQKPWEKYSATPTAETPPWEKYGGTSTETIPGTEKFGGGAPAAPNPMLPARLATSTPAPNFQQPSIGSRALANLPSSLASSVSAMSQMSGEQPPVDPNGPKQALRNPITGKSVDVIRSPPPDPLGELSGIASAVANIATNTGESFANDPVGTIATPYAIAHGLYHGGRALTQINPERGVNRVFRPASSDSEFPKVAPEAFSDVKRFGGDVPKTIFGKPKPGNENLVPGGATSTAIEHLQGQGLEPWMARARQMGVQIPGDEIVAATRKAIPDLMRTRDPQGAAALESQAQQAFGGKAFTPDQFRDWLKTENGTLQSFYNKSAGAQGGAEMAGTPTAIEKAQADAMRETLYRHLDPENNGAGPREIQQRTGNVIGLRNAADRRSNSILGEKPVTPIGGLMAPALAIHRAMRGYPSEALSALMHPFRGPSDAMITNLYRDAPMAADLPSPPVFSPRGLLEAGPVRMGTPDASGPVRSIIPPHFGSTSTRLLEAPKGQIGVSGVTAHGIDALAARRMAAGPSQLTAPTSGIGVSGNLMPNETEPLTRRMTGGPPLLPAPEPGQPPLNLIQGNPSLISPGESANINTTSPITAGGIRGGRMLDILKSMREKVK